MRRREFISLVGGKASVRPPAGRDEAITVVTDVGSWLRNLNLEQYEIAFRENAIDGTILPSLTAEDLKDLGVKVVGHRRKLLNAIAALHPAAAVKASASNTAIDSLSKKDVDRRQVTVMFSDLVGWTALSERLDPEDLREIIVAYHKCVAEIVRRFDGFVAQHLGDGVLVYFGYPTAHEDDADRAVQAGLELVTAVGRLKTYAQLQTRVGIDTGLVLIGDLMGPSEEHGVIGETPNLAARLQALADPNTVIIAEGTRKLLGNIFELDELGARNVKGIDRPVRAWTALRRSSVDSRFEALHADDLTSLAGRQEESELLQRRWAQAKRGEGKVVSLSGEAGIGKSRLIAELLRCLAGERHTRLRYFCSPQHSDNAFYPIIRHIERAIRLTHSDTPQEKLDKLDEMLVQTSTSIEDAAIIAEMLSLPNDGRYPATELSSEQRRQKTLEALSFQIEALARRNPILMVFEDAQWMDPTTLETLRRTVEQIRTLPALLIVTFRPEFVASWIGLAHVTTLTLNRLTEREIEEIIDDLAGNRLLQGGTRQNIIERADGIPLYAEEMTKAVLEANIEVDSRRAVLSRSVPVPASLRASLMARLDRLGPAKEVAQIGATVGREFSHAVLVEVAREPKPILEEALERLVQAGLLFRRGVPPETTYLFKHALVQDAAYDSVLHSQRSVLHARIVDALLKTVQNAEETQAALLGYHCAQAGLIEKAASYYRRAGERSAARAALVETLKQLQRGLTLLKALPESATRSVLEAELEIALGRVLLSTSGSPALDAGEVFEKAVARCRDLGRTDLLTRALWGFWFNLAHRDMTIADAPAHELLGIAESQKDFSAEFVARTMLGVTRLWEGRFEEGRVNFETASDIVSTSQHSALDLAIVSDHIDIHIRIQLALTLTCLGYLDQADAGANAAVDQSRTIRHLPTRAIVLGAKCRHDWFVGDDKTHQSSATELVRLSEDQGMPFYLALGRGHLGWLAAKDGRVSEGLELLHAGLVDLRSRDAIIWEPYYCGMTADAEIWAGNFDEAERLLAQALDTSKRTGGHWFDSELHRREGEIFLLRGIPDDRAAERSFREAISIAQRQSAKLWELRAAIGLARLWSQCGRRAEARRLLAPAHAWFTEGVETSIVREAAELLARLAN